MKLHILACPNCETSFKLDANALAPTGAVVRCTACATRWFAHEDGSQGPIVSEETSQTLEKPFIAQETIPLVPELETLQETPARPAKRPLLKQAQVIETPQRKMPWSVFVILAACMLLLGFLLGRETVLRNLPQTAPLYNALGFETNLIGLEFQNITTKRIEDKTADILIIEGKIYNALEKTTKIPKIKLSLREKGGKEIYTWDAPAPQDTLERKASVEFRARLASPPLEGYDVLIRFAKENEP